jgi:NAD(P)-dependent dehydrogenase (short-subunit alcohol dehydrogenase family)
MAPELTTAWLWREQKMLAHHEQAGTPVPLFQEETWDLTFAVNVKRVFLACQAAIPPLKTRGSGCIINIASIAGKNGAAGLAHYCASKFAVVGFTNSLAKELAPANIRVNAICPGILRTQMWEYLAERLKGPAESKEDAWRRYVKGLIPLCRPQTPDDIGQLAVYLAQRPKYHRSGNQCGRRRRIALRRRSAPSAGGRTSNSFLPVRRLLHEVRERALSQSQSPIGSSATFPRAAPWSSRKMADPAPR